MNPNSKKMKFNFYNDLTKEEQYRYDKMLEIHYILLSSEAFDFYETKGLKDSKVSRTWLYSLKNILQTFKYPVDSYPDGSITANRIYIELVLSQLEAHSEEFNELSEKTLNFIKHRRDDDSYNKSYLFGSTYDIISQKASHNNIPQKIVSVGLRHSISALCTIILISKRYSEQFIESLNAVNNRFFSYLAENSDWKNDRYKFLTIASFINLYNKLDKNALDKAQVILLDSNYNQAVQMLLNNMECIGENLSGYYEFKTPNVTDAFEDYFFFFECSALVLIPDLISERKIQLIIEGLIKNGVDSDFGFGLPIFPLTNEKDNKLKPDFGISSAILFLLWYALENQLGDAQWLNFCKKNFHKILSYCLNSFDDISSYSFVLSENYSKILFMPSFCSLNNSLVISTLKKAIHHEVTLNKSCVAKDFGKLQLSLEYDIIIKIIETWQIRKTIKRMKNKFKLSKDLHLIIGEFFGAFYKIANSIE